MGNIEPKYLAPYLPYGLKVLIYFGCPAQQIKTMLGISFNKTLTIRVNYYKSTSESRKFIPIFHPLTDLTKEIEINGEKFIPKDKLYEKWSNKHSYTYNFLKRESNCKKDFDLIFNNVYSEKGYDYLEHWMYQDLIKWHFDLFFLIKKGQAVDINTL